MVKLNWLFAPPYPKELIPILRPSLPDSGHLVAPVTIFTPHSSVLILGLMFLTPMVAGMHPFCNARVALMMLESPLVASLWPRLVFTYSRQYQHIPMESYEGL